MTNPENELEALKAQVAALSARVQHLEQQAQPTGAESDTRQQVVPSAVSPGPPPSPPSPIASPQATALPPSGTMLEPLPRRTDFNLRPVDGRPVRGRPPSPAVSSGDGDFEKEIGQYWLNRIGIVAILIGVSYFLKYAFENNWIGPGGRIAIGLLVGIGLVMWGERFRSRGHKAFSYSLQATGIGTLYLSLWGAFQVYHLIPAPAAFLAMMVVTGATITLALTQNTELLASFALVGGFATPVLLSTGQNHEVVLFSYVGLLDLAILAVAMRKPWRRLLWGSFVGTIMLYGGWYMEFYSNDQRTLTVFFAALFATIFATVPLATPYGRSKRFDGPSLTLTAIPLLNACVFFFALYGMYEQESPTLTWYALLLGAAYLGISNLFERRLPGEDTQFIRLLHVAIAVAFITVAIPLRLDGHWITIGWLIEAAALLWVSVKSQMKFLHYLAVSALLLGILRLLLYDNFHTETLVFNARFATYLVAVAVLGGLVSFGRHHVSEKGIVYLHAGLIALNLLALIALTMEASDYFDRRVLASNPQQAGFAGYVQLRIARDFSYSAIWLIYGAGLMAIGFWKRSALVRWQSLVLIAITIMKVFLYDVSALEQGYRILSFVALGAVLLGISFIYQRDWLKLSPRPAREKTEGAA